MRSVLPFTLSLLIPATVAAQVRESVTVEVVEVPVYVTRADGTPIRGLTKDAFELRVNGRPQPAEFFEAIDYAATNTATSPPGRGATFTSGGCTFWPSTASTTRRCRGCRKRRCG